MNRNLLISCILSILCVLNIVIVAIFLLHTDYSLKYSKEEEKWSARRDEIRSRLREVPILLYHNVDGKGEFSVSQKQLREHFEFIRKSGLRVVSLKSLVDHIEKGESYDEKVVVITFDDGYKSMYEKLLPLSLEYKYALTLFVYLDFVKDSSKKMITWDNLREMQQKGIDIQSHTVTHSDLSKLANSDDLNVRGKLYRELCLSKKIIEDRIGSNCDFIAFPYGYYNSSAVYAAKLAGYTRVFTTEFGMNVITRDNYCMKRHHIKRSYSVKRLKKILEI